MVQRHRLVTQIAWPQGKKDLIARAGEHGARECKLCLNLLYTFIPCFRHAFFGHVFEGELNLLGVVLIT
jgi:hypothetical protein